MRAALFQKDTLILGILWPGETHLLGDPTLTMSKIAGLKQSLCSGSLDTLKGSHFVLLKGTMTFLLQLLTQKLPRRTTVKPWEPLSALACLREGLSQMETLNDVLKAPQQSNTSSQAQALLAPTRSLERVP